MRSCVMKLCAESYLHHDTRFDKEEVLSKEYKFQSASKRHFAVRARQDPS